MYIDDLLRLMIEKDASDLHLSVPGPPVLRINGDLIPADGQSKLTVQDLTETLAHVTSEEQRRIFEKDLELDFAYNLTGVCRFRVNACITTGKPSLVFRLVRTTVPSLANLGLPELCQTLVLKSRGLVLVTGPSGCGKSTTLAAMIDYLNETECRRIITIEDPIEFVHYNRKCLISQREVGIDTRSFAAALRQALRQDPNVILVGEMRDLETFTAVLTAAETGHLILSTAHAPSASQTIDRIMDFFPPYQQQQALARLSTIIEGVLCQSLVRKSDGSGRVPAVEVMLGTGAIRTLIREGRIHQIPFAIQTGSQYGMQTMNQALLELCRRRVISWKEAQSKSTDPEGLENLISAG